MLGFCKVSFLIFIDYILTAIYVLRSTGALEGQIFKKFKRLTKLSDQQLVDCSGAHGNMGCRAGIVGFAYRYIHDEGITVYGRYPYHGIVKNCTYNPTYKNATVDGYSWVYASDEVFLLNLLFTVGPLVVGVDASLFSFQNYKTGIYDDEDCNKIFINHAMLLVGFGTDETWGDYWIIKNR